MRAFDFVKAPLVRVLCVGLRTSAHMTAEGAKKETAPGLRVWSPTTLLSRPERAYLLKAKRDKEIHAGMAVPVPPGGAILSKGLGSTDPIHGDRHTWIIARPPTERQA